MCTVYNTVLIGRLCMCLGVAECVFRSCVYCSTSANMAAVDGRRYWESAVQISLIPIVYSDLLGLFLRVIR